MFHGGPYCEEVNRGEGLLGAIAQKYPLRGNLVLNIFRDVMTIVQTW